MKVGGYEFEVLRNYDLLQRIVRNSDYERLCEEITFDKDGFAEIDPLSLANVENDIEKFAIKQCDKVIKIRGVTWVKKEYKERLKVREEKINNEQGRLKQIRKKFGLTQPIHPSIILENKFSPEFFSQIPIFERDPFACMLEFHRTENQDGEILSTPIQDDQCFLIRIDRMAPAKAVKSAINEYLTLYREYLPMGLKDSAAPACECLHIGNDQVRLKINMLSFNRDIFREIEKYLAPPTEWIHFKARSGCYSIWDKRKEQASFSEIALKFRVKEDQARKRFRRAFELITGQEYNKSMRQELIRNHLVKKAVNSKGKEQINAFEELGKFEDIKQREKSLEEKRGGPEKQKEKRQKKENSQSDSISDDQMSQLFLKEILEQICPNCPDTECEAKRVTVSTIKDITILECPRVHDYLTS